MQSRKSDSDAVLSMRGWELKPLRPGVTKPLGCCLKELWGTGIQRTPRVKRNREGKISTPCWPPLPSQPQDRGRGMGAGPPCGWMMLSEVSRKRCTQLLQAWCLLGSITAQQTSPLGSSRVTWGTTQAQQVTKTLTELPPKLRPRDMGGYRAWAHYLKTPSSVVPSSNTPSSQPPPGPLLPLII